MIKRPVELVCTDRRQHPLRELAVVEPAEPMVELSSESLQLGVQMPDETPDERRGFGVRTGVTMVEGQSVRHRYKTEVELRQSRSGAWTVHVKCPTCGRGPRIPMDLVVRYEQAQHAAPRVVLDVSALARTH